ncbi:MAG: aminoacyl-tRNA hydrolase [Puniceicoccales bacterium]|jgi:PTH1 family peptidyl-tRNA hydrolase|nr:aminoacyl-tRNA hydrolase [Puniceicoccales bacterium]
MFFKVVVGLGNYGVLYEHTRHNMGFIVIDSFAKALGYEIWKREKGMSVFLMKIPQLDGSLLLIKSSGYVNQSGGPVAKVCSFYKILSQEVIIICDDITLELGNVKITERQGTAGHNGVKDILEKIGPGFIRFRVGIGQKKYPEMGLTDHVLSRFDEGEGEILAKKMPNICNDLQLLLDKGILSAMNIVNRSICKRNLTEQL